jgi:BirA family transcriptional regulator, biotin operon repressor / biotin---[acetyl-CoA-carboxylase] ligase
MSELRLLHEETTRVIGRRVWFVDDCESTNDLAVTERARLQHGDVLWAGTQRRGRGRQGRVWFTPRGSLALTVVLRTAAAAPSGTANGEERPSMRCTPAAHPDGTAADTAQPSMRCTPAAHPAHLPLVLALGIVRWLATQGVTAQVKWPNDVYLLGRKLAGILTEGGEQHGTWELRVGIGMNVCVPDADFPAEVRDAAISLLQAQCGLTPRQALDGMLPFLDAVWQEEERGGWPLLRAECERVLLWRQQRVRAVSGTTVTEGMLQGLTDAGFLQLDTGTLCAGDISPLTGD